MIYFDTNEIFNWVNPKDFNQDNYSNDSPIGCFLEFNLDYLDKAKVTKEMLRPNINYKN